MQKTILVVVVLLILGLAAIAVYSTKYPEDYYSGTKTSQAAYQQPEEKCWGQRAVDDPVSVFTALLVIVAFFQLGLFWWQLNLIRDSADDAKIAAEAALRAAVATENSVEGASKTAKRQLRAYVLVTGANIVAADESGRALFVPSSSGPVNRMIGENTRPLIQLELTNTGETPAHEVSVYGAAKIVSWPLNEKDLPEIPLDQITVSRNLLGRNQISHKYEILAPLTEADMACLLGGCAAIFVHGEAHYRDVFDDPQVTKYRYFTGGAISVRGGALSPHEHGNEAT